MSSDSESVMMNPNPVMKRHKSKKEYETIPNWSDIPEEIWVLILSKIRNTICLVVVVQRVCSLFRKICKRPSMYQVLDMEPLDSDLEYTFHAVARCAVDRSAGCVIRLNLDCPCDYFTLNYIITRSKNLRHLQLGWYAGVSDRDLIEVATSLPMLEELHIRCPLSGTYIEPVGRSCCALKAFTLDHVEPTGWVRISDEEALAVGRSMPNLLHLQLIGNGMTNVGLKAILDGCPLLESLDLRGCLQIDLSGDMGENCERIKNLRRPYDSTVIYPVEHWIDFDSKLTGEDDDYGFF